jgi:hypothetical protein
MLVNHKLLTAIDEGFPLTNTPLINKES